MKILLPLFFCARGTGVLAQPEGEFNCAKATVIFFKDVV